MLAMDDDMPREAGEASAEGLFITAVMVAEGRDRSCIDDRNELFLSDTINIPRSENVTVFAYGTNVHDSGTDRKGQSSTK